MTQKDILFELINEYHGIITMSDAYEKGVRKNLFGELVKKGELVKVSAGLYALPGEDIDEYIQLAYRVPQGVFSHDTAAYLNGLTTRMPLVYFMTVKSGTNVHRVKKDMLQVQFKYIDKKFINLGKCQIMTPYGRTVASYDRERTVLDLIKSSDTDSALFGEVLNNYFKSDDRDIYKLTNYAIEMKLEAKLRKYTEVLL